MYQALSPPEAWVALAAFSALLNRRRAPGRASFASRNALLQTLVARASRTQGFHAWRAKQGSADERSATRRLKPLEKKALDSLHLTESATKVEVKARYKDLVKQHHPDVNGGDRSSEDKLREIIQAYNLLKQAGLG